MNDNPIKQYLPILGMVLAATLQVLYVAVADNRLSPVEIVNLFVALLAAVAVYVVPRMPGVLWLKPAVAALGAALMVFVDAMQGSGVNAQTWVQAGIALIIGTGIVVATNKNVPLVRGTLAKPVVGEVAA